MNWSERYAAQGDDMPTVIKKIRDNVTKYKDARSAPHTWLKNYDNAIANGANHRNLMTVCRDNASQAHQMAQTNSSRYYSNKNLWNELGDHHMRESH